VFQGLSLPLGWVFSEVSGSVSGFGHFAGFFYILGVGIASLIVGLLMLLW